MSKDKPKRPKIMIQLIQPPQQDVDWSITLTIKGQEYESVQKDFQMKKLIGKGPYGCVEEVLHAPSNTVLAVKKIKSPWLGVEGHTYLADINVKLRQLSSEWLVEYYGAVYNQPNEVWIFMELMETSLHLVSKKLTAEQEKIPEDILTKVSFSVVKALDYLQPVFKTSPFGVKPSNILISAAGRVKLSLDAWICCQLVKDKNSCMMDDDKMVYFCPERINGMSKDPHKSDVWCVGITLIKLATGEHPYKKCDNLFEQVKEVVSEAAPKLPQDKFSEEICDFVDKCLYKDPVTRWNTPQLLEHPFLVTTSQQDIDIVDYMTQISGILQNS